MTMSDKRRALGRGLDALLPSAGPAETRAPSEAPPSPTDAAFSCPLERIVPQKGQPRQHFDSARIDELAASIKEHGLLEPIVVRRTLKDDRYEIIAGERRWRAAQRAGLRDVLVVVKDVAPGAVFELALIENVQREDLNPVELAEALDRLVREHGYTQEALATRVGKDRTTIANSLRLLRLPAAVRSMVVAGTLSEGHARALLGLSDDKVMEALAQRIARTELSVRETEKLVRQAKDKGASPSEASGAAPAKSASVRDLEARLSRKLGARVEVRDTSGKGDIVIRYGSLDELDRILDLLLA